MAGPITDADREAIRDFYDGWSDALLEERYEEMLELYTDDAVMVPPNQPALRRPPVGDRLAFVRASSQVPE